MLLPDKNTASDQALVTVAGQILIQLGYPRSITATLDALRDWRTREGMDSVVPFWWFALALDVLYQIGAVEMQNGQIGRVRARTTR